MSSPLSILCLENDVADAQLLQETLETEGIACKLNRVEAECDFRAALQQGGFDLILADYTLPSFDGMSALRMVRQQLPEVPFIFVSGTLGEEVAIEALKTGATDYVFKTRLSRLVPAVQRALREAEERAERKRAEEAARRSEKELRDAIEIIPGMVFIALPGASNAFVSRSWREYTGLSAQDTSGSGWQTAIHPEDLERHLKKWQVISATGEPFEDEARFRRAADGNYRWFLVRAVPFHDNRGKVLKWYGVLTDIEDRKRAEEAVRRSETQLRNVIDAMPAAVWSVSPDGAVDFANQGWLEITGLPLEAALGWNWQQVIHPDDRQRFVAEWRTALNNGQALQSEARQRTPEGEYRWFFIRSVPLRDELGRIIKWYGTAIDIEDRKRAEEQRERLLQLEAELAHMDRIIILGELAASIAHEVNQPLSGIVSSGGACLRWLAADPPNLDEVREAVRRIVGAGKYAGEVIARIRALTKRTESPKEKLDLNETIREVHILVGDEAKRNKVIIRTDFADGLSPVLGDRVQLQQVLLNLFINAIEAMTSVSERKRELVITTRNIDPEQVQVTVEDSGIGIDPNAIQKIFDPFYTTKSTGMGMGLSISRSILQRHNGRLWATTKDGSGTSFHFALPKCHEEESNAGAA